MVIEPFQRESGLITEIWTNKLLKKRLLEATVARPTWTTFRRTLMQFDGDFNSHPRILLLKTKMPAKTGVSFLQVLPIVASILPNWFWLVVHKSLPLALIYYFEELLSKDYISLLGSGPIKYSEFESRHYLTNTSSVDLLWSSRGWDVVLWPRFCILHRGKVALVGRFEEFNWRVCQFALQVFRGDPETSSILNNCLGLKYIIL